MKNQPRAVGLCWGLSLFALLLGLASSACESTGPLCAFVGDCPAPGTAPEPAGDGGVSPQGADAGAPQPTACASDAECSAGQRCIAGACMPWDFTPGLVAGAGGSAPPDGGRDLGSGDGGVGDGGVAAMRGE